MANLLDKLGISNDNQTIRLDRSTFKDLNVLNDQVIKGLRIDHESKSVQEKVITDRVTALDQLFIATFRLLGKYAVSVRVRYENGTEEQAILNKFNIEDQKISSICWAQFYFDLNPDGGVDVDTLALLFMRKIGSPENLNHQFLEIT